MSLRQQEKSLKNEIEDEGLERYVRHLRFEKELGEPVNVIIEDKEYRNTSDLTIAILVEKDIDEEEKEKILDYLNNDVKERIDDMLYDDDELEIESDGFAICDKRDTFNKRLGRVIATGRALKNYRE